jgi:tRNA-dihydrouridine synthase A
MIFDLATSRRFSIAPMMDWTDRHCRYLHRLLTRRALLFTEMVTSPAVVHGRRERLLGYDPAEQPLALQLGGSDPPNWPRRCASAPSSAMPRSTSMSAARPTASSPAASAPASWPSPPRRRLRPRHARCDRCAGDGQVPARHRRPGHRAEPRPLRRRHGRAGVDALYVHARKAWLKGLSPKENRTIPPLDYPRVYRLAERLAPCP